jgi:hypothetical protein
LNNSVPLTDDFPKSGRGLWILFSIGVIYQVVGINFSDSSIEIPWFPKITLQHPERIILLYTVMLFFALYRYYLHNQEIFINFWSEAFEWSLKNSKLGNWFVRKFIFGKDCGPFVVSRGQISSVENVKHSQVTIRSDFTSDGGENEDGNFSVSFLLFFTVGQDLSCSFHEHFSQGHYYEVLDRYKAIWRLERLDSNYYASEGRFAWNLRLFIVLLTLVGLPKIIGRNVVNFEHVLPFFANTCLLFYLVIFGL